MRRSLKMEIHKVHYAEYRAPLWFVLLLKDQGNRIEIIIVGGETADEVSEKL